MKNEEKNTKTDITTMKFSSFVIRHTSFSSGFTLLEMIVSLAIFSIVAVVAVGSLARIVGLNRQAQTLQSSMNNVSFALESMSRELRVGSQYDCTTALNLINFSFDSTNKKSNLVPTQCPISAPPSGEKFLAFVSSKKSPNNLDCRLIYVYRFTPTWSLKKAQQTSCGSTLTDNDFAPILDETNVHVTDYRLGVYFIPTLVSPSLHSFAFIRLIGYAGVREQDKNFLDIESSVSQRINDSPQ